MTSLEMRGYMGFLRVLFSLVLMTFASVSHAHSAFGFADRNNWFACSKAKDSAAQFAADTCMETNQSLGEAVFSDCYEHTLSNTMRHGNSTYYIAELGYRVDVKYSCE